MLYALKLILSATIIVAASELAKRSGLIGGLVASLPLVSIITLSWLYWETRDIGKVNALCQGIFWMVIPSLVLFLCLPVLLKKGLPFFGALTLSCGITLAVYSLATMLYTRLGVKF